MNDLTRKPITGFTSIILDSLRIISALTVVTFHAFLHWTPKGDIANTLQRFAHTAVVVFFVLSGYLIAFSTSQKKSPVKYFKARSSRLYSVLIPGITLTAICEVIIRLLDHNLYLQYNRGHSIPRYILSFFYSNEIWFLSSAPPLNSPLWSLSFEFWYYMIFGLFYFRNDVKYSKILLLMACLIAGPKILLMMPIWLFGYLAYKVSAGKTKLIYNYVSVIVCLPLIFIVSSLPTLPYKLGTPPLLFASQFITDWINGILVAYLIWRISSWKIHIDLRMSAKKLRNIADLTFPLYVIHMPIIVLFDAIFHPMILKDNSVWWPLITIIIICTGIGYIIEKYSYIWYNLIDRIFHKYLIKVEKRSVI